MRATSEENVSSAPAFKRLSSTCCSQIELSGYIWPIAWYSGVICHPIIQIEAMIEMETY